MYGTGMCLHQRLCHNRVLFRGTHRDGSCLKVSAAKVQFSPVLCLCGQNPEPDPWSGSGDLAEPRTGPQFGVHNGPVPVQGGCDVAHFCVTDVTDR